MNDRTQENAESPVLLSYRCPRWVRGYFLFTALGIVCCSGAALVWSALSSCQDLVLGAAALVFAAVLGFGLMFIRCVVFAFNCTRFDIEVTTMLGRRENIRWAEVRSFKRYTEDALLRSNNHPMLSFQYIPQKDIDALAAILRETSDARIVGFD